MTALHTLNRTRLEWQGRLPYDLETAQGGAVAVLRRRQGLELPLYAPAGLLLVGEGQVQVQRHGLDAMLTTGDVLVLEEGGGGTLHLTPTTSSTVAVWIGLPRRDMRNAWFSQCVSPAPAAVQQLLALALEGPGSALAAALQPALDALRPLQNELTTLLPQCPGRSRRHREDVLQRLQRVKSLLDAPCGPIQELELLAQAASYSLSHFQRMFTRVYGLSPIEHQRRSRLTRARELIASESLSVREVAERVGFESRSTFNRLFREHYGDSAGRVRAARC